MGSQCDAQSAVDSVKEVDVWSFEVTIRAKAGLFFFGA